MEVYTYAKPNKLFIFKELTLGVLAVLSVGLVLFELLGHPSGQQTKDIAHVDFGIACTFLLDFALSLSATRNRRQYLRHNWYFLLAAIPFTDTVTESLRVLRVLSLVRLVRAGEHLGFAAQENSRHNGKPVSK